MEKIFVGDFIRAKRMERDLSQEQLCQNVCEPITVSRLENGRNMPSHDTISKLLQKLGQPERYVILLSKNEMEIEALKEEIVHCNVQRKKDEGRIKLRELEEITEADDKLTRQFILRSRVLLGRPDGEYSFEEKLQMLREAIGLTVYNFDPERIEHSFYTLEEVKIINQIAMTYSDNGDHKTAANIYQKLFENICKNIKNKIQSGGYLPMVAFNYSRELALRKHYEDAIEIAEIGWKYCIDYANSQFLPGLIVIMAECYYYLDDIQKSKKMYIQAYHLYGALGRQRDVDRVRKEIKGYFGLELEPYEWSPSFLRKTIGSGSGSSA